MKLNVQIKPCKCAHPAIAVMDYLQSSPAGWHNPKPRVNRCCTKCWAHWFGPPNAIKSYTKSQWDAYISEAA